MELMRITTKYEWLMQETERVDNEVFCLTRQNENLNESYNEAAEQREYEQNELLSLNTKLNESQGEKAKISNMLKGATISTKKNGLGLRIYSNINEFSPPREMYATRSEDT